MTKPSIVSHEDFVRAWVSSHNAREVASKTGLDHGACSRRAHYLRKRGVNLPKFMGPERVDVAGLNRIIEGAE